MLKRIGSILTILLVMGGATAALAAQKEMRRDITFSEDILIAGQLVRKGTYTLVYQPGVEGQATLMKGAEVVVRAPYRLRSLDKKATANSFSYRRTGPQPVLLQIVFSGQREALVFEEGGR